MTTDRLVADYDPFNRCPACVSPETYSVHTHAPSISETAAMRASALDDMLSVVWQCERWERQERHIDNLVRYSR